MLARLIECRVDLTAVAVWEGYTLNETARASSQPRWDLLPLESEADVREWLAATGLVEMIEDAVAVRALDRFRGGYRGPALSDCTRSASLVTTVLSH
jgi:hypothetical protein